MCPLHHGSVKMRHLILLINSGGGGVFLLVIRGVPFLILIRLRVSVPLNSRPVAHYRKGGTTPHLKLVLRSPALEIFKIFLFFLF